MKTSLVMATYNGLKYIEEQLESIRLQSQSLDEVLIADDGSNDGTVEFIESYIKKFNLTWELISNPQNLGWRKNFIELLKRSSGDIIFLSDQDDIWNLEKVKIMTEKMKNRPEIWLLASDFREKFENEGRPEQKHKFDFTDSEGLKKVNMSLKNLRQLRPGNCDVVRKELLPLAFDFFALNPETPHDVCLEWTAKAIGRHYIFPEALVDWRKYESSSYRKEIPESLFKGTIKVHQQYSRLYKNLLDVTEKYQELILDYQQIKPLIEMKKQQYDDIVNYLKSKSLLAPLKVFKRSGILKTLNLIRIKLFK
ncbi:MAG: glycosyltransferase [Lactovum sp.]